MFGAISSSIGSESSASGTMVQKEAGTETRKDSYFSIGVATLGARCVGTSLFNYINIFMYIVFYP